MDYCIPRNQIIEELELGYGLPLASEIGSNMIGYNSSIQARNINLTKAKLLLGEVFGKIYDPDLVLTDSETYTDVPYFNITLISPSTTIDRAPWWRSINSSFTSAGIDVDLVWWTYGGIFRRLYLNIPWEPVGANFDHGGFDGLFFGFGTSTDPDLGCIISIFNYCFTNFSNIHCRS